MEVQRTGTAGDPTKSELEALLFDPSWCSVNARQIATAISEIKAAQIGPGAMSLRQTESLLIHPLYRLVAIRNFMGQMYDVDNAGDLKLASLVAECVANRMHLLAYELVASFKELPAEQIPETGITMPAAILLLQMCITGDAFIPMKTALLEDIGKDELMSTMMYVLKTDCPFSGTMYETQMRAACILAVFFGSDESGGGADTFQMPEEVAGMLVGFLDRATSGKNSGSLVNVALCIRELSFSDSNILKLVDAGILDGIQVIFTAGEEIMGGWTAFFRYNVTAVRHAFASTLANLCLCTGTEDAVKRHGGILNAVDHAVADTKYRLPATSARLLSGLARKYSALGLPPPLPSGATPSEQNHHEQSGAKHLMLSYCWAQQKAVVRIYHALVANGLNVWIDIEQMQGSTVGAMADAIDNCSLILFCISNEYKNSASCRLEANYSHQQQVPMIPLMLVDGYKPNGWLGMLLGTKLWHGFYGNTLSDHFAFDGAIGKLVREIGSQVDRSSGDARAGGSLQQPQLEKQQPSSKSDQSTPLPCPTTLKSMHSLPAAAANRSPYSVSSSPAQLPCNVSPRGMTPTVASRVSPTPARLPHTPIASPLDGSFSTAEGAMAAMVTLGERAGGLREIGLLAAGVEEAVSDLIGDWAAAQAAEAELRNKIQTLLTIVAAVPGDAALARQLTRRLGSKGGT
jgi:hypothetical protein